MKTSLNATNNTRLDAFGDDGDDDDSDSDSDDDAIELVEVILGLATW